MNGGWIVWVISAFFIFGIIVKTPPTKYQVMRSTALARAQARRQYTGVENGGEGA